MNETGGKTYDAPTESDDWEKDIESKSLHIYSAGEFGKNVEDIEDRNGGLS